MPPNAASVLEVLLARFTWVCCLALVSGCVADDAQDGPDSRGTTGNGEPKQDPDHDGYPAPSSEACEGAPFVSDRGDWETDGAQHPLSVCDAPRAADSITDLEVVFASDEEGNDRAQKFGIYIPEDVCMVRCALVRMNGLISRVPLDPHNANSQIGHRFAAQHGCAIVEAPPCKLEEVDGDLNVNTLDVALTQFAAHTGRPELAYVPWAFLGYSCSAGALGSMAEKRPDRVIGGVSSNCGLDMKAALDIPAFVALSGLDQVCTPKGASDRAREGLAAGAKMALAIVPDKEHGNLIGAHHVLYSFLDAILEQRLPDTWDGTTPPVLAAVDPSSGLFGHHTTLEVGPADVDQWPHPREQTSWLPNEHVARRWQEIWCGLE